MYTLLNRMSGLSYIRIVISAGIVGIVLGMIFTGYRALQTPVSHVRLGPKFIAPSPAHTNRPNGPIPLQPPKISGVFPWIGKSEDAVLIKGKHFGENPSEKQLLFGSLPIEENRILDWTDTEIQALIPKDAASGESIRIAVGNYPPAVSAPIAIYDRETELQLEKNGTVITASAPQNIHTVRWWSISGEDLQQHEENHGNPSDPFLFDAQNEEIQSLLLYDASGALIPYYVDPIAFGF